MEEIKPLLKKININYIQMINCEADDIIASFITQTTKIHPNTIFDILTRDKDLLQLINENNNILKYINGKITLYTYHQFLQEYNFSPENYVDYLSLLGDNVDNISGIKGIGPVSAKKLIEKFKTVENIYQKIDNLPENNKNLLENKEELVFCNKKIISLEKNLSLQANIYKECNFN
jgi:DNA polymerase-1